MNDKTKTFSVHELCSMLNIGRNTAYTLIKTKKLKAFKIGKSWKIPASSVEEYIRQSILDS